MFKPSKKQISTLIGGATLIGIVAMLAYAAVFFAPSKQPIGYVGQPTMSNFNVTSNNEHVYRGVYDPSDWSGRFECYPITSTGYINLTAPCFTAGASSPLDIQAASNVRNIGTMNDVNGNGVDFTYNTISANEQTLMGGTANGANNINFIRGTSLSPSGLRTRKTVLGDIVHSRPYYYTDGTNPTVFVGANDGMLHAFDATVGTATSGQERWAYLPAMLMSKLNSSGNAFSSTGYTHDYFVDGSMAIAKYGTGSTAQTILVGALGAGGQGLYALDISSLTASTGAQAGQKRLWEITPTSVNGVSGVVATTNFANLGYTYSNPVLVKTQDGSDAVIVGNGYNNTGTGTAVLYVINAHNGSLIKAIDTGVGSTTSPNGLSTPTAIDSNGDGMVDRVYAGDINGNMWVFNLLSSNATTWSSAITTGSTPQPLYSIPQGAASAPIAITQAPAISVHPFGGFMVDFASGRILSGPSAAVISPSTAAAIDDTSDTITPYAAYGLWDNPNLNTTISNTSTAAIMTQSIATTTYNPTGTSPAASAVTVVHLTTDNKPNWLADGSGTRGWKVLLKLAGGERVTGDGAYIDAGRFQFNVSNPTVAYTPTGASATSNGVNWLFGLDYLSGGAGITPFMDLDNNGVVNNFDLLKDASGSPVLSASGIPVAYVTSNGVQSQPILMQLSKTRLPLYNQNYNSNPLPNTPGTGINGGHFDVDILYNSGGINTPAQCSGGTLSVDSTGCAGTCLGGTVTADGSACLTIPASCTGGTLNNAGTACTTTGAKCTGGTLNQNGNACVTVKCSSGSVNAAGSGCSKRSARATTLASPGTFVPGVTIGTFVPASTPGIYTPSAGTYTAAVTGSAQFSTQQSHRHEYDKLYDTNGLNFLNPNDNSEALTNAMPSATTPYKVLVMNQAWNRAMNLRIGVWMVNGARTTTINSQQYLTMSSKDVITNYISSSCSNTQSNISNLNIGCLDVANMPTYTGNTSTVSAFSTVPANTKTDIPGKVNVTQVTTTGSIRCGGMTALGTPYLSGTTCDTTGTTTDARGNVGGLEISLPSNGFAIRDWWGDGNVMTGVNPTHPNCPDTTNNDGTLPANSTGHSNQYIGPSGERHDGTLTVQIIRAGTPNTDVQMNVPGHPEYGFRVIDSMILYDVLAEYILYWHHPNAICMGDGTSTWSATNISGDPWWPAQSTLTTAAAGNRVVMGILTCDGNGPNFNGGYSASGWSKTAYAAANISPLSTPAGSSANGPAGWTINPPMDSALTLPPCPTYNATADDPRTASFVFPQSGTAGASGVPASAYLGSGMGGSTQLTGTVTGGGTGSSSSVSATSGVQNTYQQNGASASGHRITWRELIGL
ncbi:MAG: PilC/PilY family type IV pilus protein [Gallionella sp.]